MRVECIVMDDDSNDRTAEIAREMGAKVYNVTYDNNGNTWIGKSYACYLGASYTASDILIFMDADVELNNEHAPRGNYSVICTTTISWINEYSTVSCCL